MNNSENNPSHDPKAGPTDFDLIQGGRNVEILVGDKKETVFVKLLPIKSYPALLAALNDEEKQAELFCDKPAGWAAGLNPMAHDAIMQAGEALNSVPFFKWFARQAARTEMLAPGRMAGMMKEAMAEAIKR